MGALTDIWSTTRAFLMKFSLLDRAREMHWAADRRTKLLESIQANIERLADKTDSQVAVVEKLHNMMADQFLSDHLHDNPRYLETGRLNRYERQVFSQTGEDGIIDEIFARIGTTNRVFVEFGVGNGLENNTTCLLTKGWSGYWLEARDEWVRDIENSFRELLDTRQLTVRQAFITAENIESLFAAADVPKEFDLLCIDIDGNDYWVWKAIANYSPRVLVIEYNALFSPDMKWVMRYNPAAIWNRTSYQGASLKALEVLGQEKGYQLVGCSFAGINAFFVRSDLVSEAFCTPFTAENHYEPARYHLVRTPGHPRGFGNFVRP
jgi:hypothetical protein